MSWYCLQESILGVFFLSGKEELLWQINCGIEETTAVNLSDISPDTNIPEGDALFSYCRDMWASSKAEVCLLAMVLGSCGLEKIRAFQVISALTLLLPLTYSVDLDRSLHIYWNNWMWPLISVAALCPTTAFLSSSVPDGSSHLQYHVLLCSISV